MTDLLPFDLPTAIAHPERVRWLEDDGRDSGRRAVKVGDFDGWALIVWIAGGMPHTYDNLDVKRSLRLAPPEPKNVKVRIGLAFDGSLMSFMDDDIDERQRQMDRGQTYLKWASDVVEILLYPESK